MVEVDDRKSVTALNASNIATRMMDLFDSTPSFGRINNDTEESQASSQVYVTNTRPFNS